MPATPFAQVQAAVGSNPATSGAITANPGDGVTLSGVNTTGWIQQLWEIYDYPAGWSTPSGWTISPEGIIYSTSVSPSSFALPSIALWGKFLIRLTVNPGSPQPLVDIATAIQTLSPNGMSDVAYLEANQFDSQRQWAGQLKNAIRLLDKSVGAGGVTSYTGGASLPSVPSQMVEIDSFAGAMTMNLPNPSKDGYVVDSYDVTDPGTSNAVTWKTTDGSYIRDPDTHALLVGSSGLVLATGRDVRFRRTSCARTAKVIWGTS